MSLNRRHIARVIENNAHMTMKDIINQNSDEDILQDIKDFITELSECIPGEQVKE
jgi:hypothetical protein